MDDRRLEDISRIRVEMDGYSAQSSFWRMKNQDLVWDFREAASYVFWTCGQTGTRIFTRVNTEEDYL